MRQHYFLLARVATLSTLCLCPIMNVFGQSGCGTPQVRAGTVGNTESCDPIDFGYIIDRYESNDPSTVYVLDFGDGTTRELRHNELDRDGEMIIRHTYQDISCESPYATDGAYTFTITATAPCNERPKVATVSPVIIGSPPVLDFNLSSPVCINEAVTFYNRSTPGTDFSCSSEATYVWDFGDGSPKETVAENRTVNHTYTRQGSFTVTLTVNQDCGSQDVKKQIVVSGPPAPRFDIGPSGNQETIIDDEEPLTIYAPTDACVPVILPLRSLTYDQGLNEEWFVDWEGTGEAAFSNNSVRASGETETITFTEPGDYRVHLITTTDCGTERSCVSVEIVDEVAPEQITIAGIPDGCAPATISPSVALQGVTGYEWNLTALSGGPAPSLPNANRANAGSVQLAAGVYELSLRVSNECGTSAPAIRTFTISDQPGPVISPASASLCPGEDVMLQVAAQAGTVYQWYIDGDSISGATGPTVLADEAGEYTVGVMVTASGCEGVSAPARVTFNSLPPSEITTTSPTRFCAEEPVRSELRAPSGPYTYQWVINGSNIDGATDATYTATEAGTYQVSIDDGRCSTLSDGLEIIEGTPPVLAASSPSANICLGERTEITASGAETFTWSPAEGLSATTGSQVTASPQATTEYTIVGTDTYGCTDTTSITIQVAPLPNTGLAMSRDTVCAGEAVTLTASGGNGYTWTSDPTLTPGSNGTATARPAVTTTYTVRARSARGCEGGIASVTVVVRGLPDISLQDQEVCVADAAFMLMAETGTEIEGTWSASGLPSGSLTAEGLFDPAVAGVNLSGHELTFTYRTTDQYACEGSVSKRVVVHPLPQPDFALPGRVCVGEAVALQNLTTVVNGSPYTWAWDFGDGNTTNEQSPQTTFASPGEYTVKLAVQGFGNCIASVEKTIEVIDGPLASFTMSTAPASACGPVTASFTNSSQGEALSYRWDFGQGDTSTASEPGDVVFPPSLYNDTTYTVSLEVTNQCTSSRQERTVRVRPVPTARLLPAVDTICADFPLELNNYTLGNADRYVWDFGDGTPPLDTEETGTVTHAFPYDGGTDTTYIVTLTAINDCEDDVATYPVVVKAIEVEAFFNADRLRGCAPHTVTFSANQDEDSNTLTWDWGDGNRSAGGISRSYTYDKPGTYTVTLTVENGCHVDTYGQEVSVLPSPEASFTMPEAVCAGDPVTLINTSSVPEGSVWTFGDSRPPYRGANPPAQAYSVPGTYTVTLSVTDPLYNCKTTVSHAVRVLPYPVASFTTDELLCAGEAPVIVNSSTDATRYRWVFRAHGETVQGHTPTPPAYQQPGRYTITLVAENELGCSSQASQEVEVVRSPEPDFEIVVLSADDRAPVEVDFVNLTEFPTEGEGSFIWRFGNGNTSEGYDSGDVQLYTNLRDSARTYTVTLEATSAAGCSRTVQKQFVVYPPPCTDWLELPTVFTPNLDDLNEVLRPLTPKDPRSYRVMSTDDGLKDYRFQIYTRWGEIIYESTDPSEGWDGKGYDEGVYIALLQYRCRGEVYKKKQEIILKR
ncbi:PKD domain-containing protein [Roseivirga sp. BDSF3-8]|uniref:PKD domain-containing protein n=1 Tax=Roseivirga sp. BDSF3-8 TaxID=3241598 RepID=UPI003531D8AA